MNSKHILVIIGGLQAQAFGRTVRDVRTEKLIELDHGVQLKTLQAIACEIHESDHALIEQG